MIVKALGKEWNVNDCTYKQRRELHALNAKVWWDGQDVDAYYKLLEKVSDIAGLSEDDFKDISMADIDQVLQAIFIDYLGLSRKKAGE
tara:strand:- start:120 stop:383 length:264 start_codon:yes stop_codon:yes gene_type:complete